MFSGIVEEAAIIEKIVESQNNLNITIKCSFVNDLKIDQSIAHNGVCLTVVEINEDNYTVTAISETLQKTNLGQLRVSNKINVERSMAINSLLDGHIVQGHVDQTAVCTNIEEVNGSWYFTFEYDTSTENFTVEKGSICVNGVSLTVVNSNKGKFQVAIIPYTYEHTNFHEIKKGDIVNLEFDIIGKYLAQLAKQYLKNNS